ncbi:envelope integrity protein Cei [Saccharopolyspora sp. HNM0983]|uniref:Envelope integrity protein Cei n=1 Tax=Saccharopolyspora montiporae TaxID=2781240 RepID=A0A929FY53_9PSEU|nr:envelope integrity protein Cei [Saccharopolyspora sp. HNM0983]MBE9373059.1 envelope integrity protein Cei [Saccharopolyspora sp. HNM0983]
MAFLRAHQVTWLCGVRCTLRRKRPAPHRTAPLAPPDSPVPLPAQCAGDSAASSIRSGVRNKCETVRARPPRRPRGTPRLRRSGRRPRAGAGSQGGAGHVSAVSARRGRQGPRYRRRRPIPALIVLVALVGLSGVVWTNVFDSVEDIETATRCAPPSPPRAGATQGTQQPIGQMLARDALDRTNPVPPQDIPVRVLNGNGESRQATLVSDELSTLGFAPAGADDDPVYVNYDLRCHGQIRYGDAGASAARTMSLIAPCAQLVRDERPDAGVDFALGADFDDIKTTQEAKQVLQELQNWVPERDQQDGTAEGITPPKISNDMMATARDVHC